MQPSTYATICAVLCGFANCIEWTGYFASAFICETVLHSVHGREPDRSHFCLVLRNFQLPDLRIGAYDGFYGLTVLNAVFMLSTLAVPSLSNYLRGKVCLKVLSEPVKPMLQWILALSGTFLTLYFLSFQILDRHLYFFSCIFLGLGFSCELQFVFESEQDEQGTNSVFNVGYTGYVTEFSTRATIERNQSLSWLIAWLQILCRGHCALLRSMLLRMMSDDSYPLLLSFFESATLAGTITITSQSPFTGASLRSACSVQEWSISS